MIFLKWLHRRQDEELLKTAEQVLKDFRNEISSMAVCGEEREVLENMIFLLLNTYMEEDEKKFLCDTDGKGCLDTLAAPLVLGENGGTYAASYDRCMEEGQRKGKYKTFARYFGKDFTPFGFDVFTGMVLLYTRRDTAPAGRCRSGAGGLEVFLSFFFVRFLYGSVWTRGCIFHGVVKSGRQADFGLAAWV